MSRALYHLLNAPPARQQENKVQPQSDIDVDGFQIERLKRHHHHLVKHNDD